MKTTGENAKIRSITVHYCLFVFRRLNTEMQAERIPSFSEFVKGHKLFDVFFNRRKYVVQAEDRDQAKQIVAKELFGDEWEDKWQFGLAKPTPKPRFSETPDDYQYNIDRRESLKDQPKQLQFDL